MALIDRFNKKSNYIKREPGTRIFRSEMFISLESET